MVWPLFLVAGKAALLAKSALVGKSAVGVKSASMAKGAMAGKGAIAASGHGHGALAGYAANKIKSAAVDIFSDQLNTRIKQISIARGDEETRATAKGDAAEFAFRLQQGDWYELVKIAGGHYQVGRKLNSRDALAKCFNQHL